MKLLLNPFKPLIPLPLIPLTPLMPPILLRFPILPIPSKPLLIMTASEGDVGRSEEMAMAG
jgi:hypothetical protein